MPKHMSLAMAIRHLSGAAQLIGLLNGFGHCVSHSVALNHDTAFANQESMFGDDALPVSIHQMWLFGIIITTSVRRLDQITERRTTQMA